MDTSHNGNHTNGDRRMSRNSPGIDMSTLTTQGHKVILAAQSEFFRQLILDEMAKQQQQRHQQQQEERR